jgi:hypothetical protein
MNHVLWTSFPIFVRKSCCSSLKFVLISLPYSVALDVTKFYVISLVSHLCHGVSAPKLFLENQDARTCILMYFGILKPVVKFLFSLLSFHKLNSTVSNKVHPPQKKNVVKMKIPAGVSSSVLGRNCFQNCYKLRCKYFHFSGSHL